MMDKSKIEKYLKTYPNDNQIVKIVEEIKDLLVKKQILLSSSIDADNRMAQSMIETIDAALELAKIELEEISEIEKKIIKGYRTLELRERDIIKARLWNKGYIFTPWNTIAKSLNYHRSTVERIYRQALKKIVAA
jgi:DNA-directed RNA polymerase sigma subunit (sigma70/sigma32)